jgi:hypothetical protein
MVTVVFDLPNREHALQESLSIGTFTQSSKHPSRRRLYQLLMKNSQQIPQNAQSQYSAGRREA